MREAGLGLRLRSDRPELVEWARVPRFILSRLCPYLPFHLLPSPDEGEEPYDDAGNAQEALNDRPAINVKVGKRVIDLRDSEDGARDHKEETNEGLHNHPIVVWKFQMPNSNFQKAEERIDFSQ